MNTEKFFCGNPRCINFGIQGLNNCIILYGYDKNIQRIQCQVCGHVFSSRLGTVFYDIKDDEELVVKSVNCLAEGVSIRATGRINNIDKDTVFYWLSRAGEHCAGLINKFFINLHLTECQLDELWSFIYAKEHNLQNLKTILEEYGDVWIWIAFAPDLKIIPAFVVGKRSQENSDLLIKKLTQVSDGNIPFFTSDALKHYKNSLLKYYGTLETPIRKPGRGRPPNPRLVPKPELKYAIVWKRRENNKVVEVLTFPVFGTEDEISMLLEKSTSSSKINVSFIERNNLSLRQGSRRLTRKTNAFSKRLPYLEKQLYLSIAYSHFVLPHKALRKKLKQQMPTRGSGSPKKWLYQTPAMATGLTDHIWTMKELLTYPIVPNHLLEQHRQFFHKQFI
jgi:IS1 family transposase/transposase-like protein